MRTVELSDLEIFRAVVKEGSVLRAAKKLHRVQSNISTRVKQLEERLGITLFDRQARGLTLTDAGEVIFDCIAIGVWLRRCMTKEVDV